LTGASGVKELKLKRENNLKIGTGPVGYITPKDVLAGRQAEIHAERDRKLEEARKQRQIRRRKAA
jgi:hypothetical protein